MANHKKEVLQNLKDWRNTLIVYAQWTDEYATWWNDKYGGKTDEEIQVMTNGSTPPPPPPRVPPE